MPNRTVSSPAYAASPSVEGKRFAPDVSVAHGHLPGWLFWSVVLVAAFLGAFVVPFLFPLKHAVFSPAYTVGGNNRMGALAVAIVAMLTCVACLRRPTRWNSVYRADTTPSRLQLPICLGIVVAFSIALGILVVRSGTYYADSGYFMTQLRSGLVFHRALYREVEFAYGPLLYLWPAWTFRALSLFGWSIAASYMAAFVAMEAVGTVLLYWTISQLPMSTRMKGVAFAMLVLLTLDPQAGLNYTAFRFILPVCSLVFLAKQERPAAAGVVAFLAAALNFAVSPELGLAFTAGASCYGIYRALTVNRRNLVISAGAIAGAAGFAVAMGRDYFRTMAEFAKGGYNDILGPAPHIYFLLVCAVTLAPLAVASALRQKTGEGANSAGLLLGIFIAGLTMLAPALGRCDPLHVSFNGWALFLLSFIAVDQMGRAGQRVWLVAAVLFCTYTIAQEYALQKGPIARVLLHRADPLESADLARLVQATSGERVAFPLNQAWSVLDQLTAKHLYEPQYLCIPAADAPAEERVVQDMRRANYAMVPNITDLITENKINNKGLRYHMRFNYEYPARNAPFMQGALTMTELKQHWKPVGVYGSYTLYHKLD